MSKSRNSGWVHTLADVEKAVDDCLAALDRYESAFAGVLHEHVAAGAASDRLPPADPTDAFQQRLAVADRKADEVEGLLAEQQLVWAQWQESYAAWRRSLEQPAG